MKRKTFINCILFTILWYILGSFLTLQFNPMVWSGDSRLIFAGFITATWLIGLMIDYLDFC